MARISPDLVVRERHVVSAPRERRVDGRERGEALRTLLYLFERDEGVRLMRSG